jgi:CDP-paratose 2-epimerase
MKKLLITGGAGFVGSNLARALHGQYTITVLDNFHRRGSEHNAHQLRNSSITVIRGDVRSPDDLTAAGDFDVLIECSADPSVQAGINDSPEYLIQTNLGGALHCAELCRQRGRGMIFLSTSRVYPFAPLQQAHYRETPTRYELEPQQTVPGLTTAGVSEAFPLAGERSLYGATKLAAELVLLEYRHAYRLPFLINRCGVLAGPGQFGTSEQGVVAHWIAAHVFNRPLCYIGFGGTGKQVRDLLHVADLAELIRFQLEHPALFLDGVFNVGGGREVSLSLCELTNLCRQTVGRTVPLTSDPQSRYADIPIYLTDTSRLRSVCDWQPRHLAEDIIRDTCKWMTQTPDLANYF